LFPYPAGPYYVNGTPLRRVAQAYVVATQTKVDISSVKLPDNLTDDYFRRTKSEKKKKDGGIFSDSKKVR
jgi:large subunit ribosomal protein L6e